MPSTSRKNRGPSAGPENRRALIAAARVEFATVGYTAPLSVVARRAGVGQGSLYRHFPDRVALAVAVFDENIAELEALAELQKTTLDDLLTKIIEQALVSTAFIDMIASDQTDERVLHLGARIRSVADRVVERERAAGRIGATVELEDVLLAVSMLTGLLSRTPAAERHGVAKRAWALFHSAFAGDHSAG